MNFVAIDLETANPDLASICQVGLAVFTANEPARTWQSLIDPEDEFSGVNISIHGIDAAQVRGAPRFSDVFQEIRSFLEGNIVVSHTAFDRVALERASDRYELPRVDCRWLDTARVARRAWNRFSRSGYGLESVAQWCGISFRHHDAEEDARAAGEILVRAISDTGISLDQWLVRAKQPLTEGLSTGSSAVKRRGDPSGPLSGEVAVFTGALTLARREAADLAAASGCDVGSSVTKKTTLLIVGDQDIRRLAGHEKSTKHRKAESLIENGQKIRILGESDFIRVIKAG